MRELSKINLFSMKALCDYDIMPWRTRLSLFSIALAMMQDNTLRRDMSLKSVMVPGAFTLGIRIIWVLLNLLEENYC